MQLSSHHFKIIMFKLWQKNTLIAVLTKISSISSNDYLDLWYSKVKDIDRMNICRTTMEREKKLIITSFTRKFVSNSQNKGMQL
ncbi:hypothetical protein AFZ25_05300 [Listeria monocytogenes]|nr:hypothetical protein AFZ25_05300 [Listeria monocytogenes]